MPFDASGTFTRIRGTDSWKGDATAGTPIKSDLHDINDNDLAAGLTGCITKDGRTQPIADIPFATRKIINLGQPTSPQDAATKRYVDEVPGWPTAKYISGADVDGRLNFTSLTGANGITWSNIGAAWLARLAVADRERNRVVLNNAVDGSGVDVIAIDELNGSLAFPAQFETSQNLIFDGTSWRTPSAGSGGILRKTADALRLLSNFTATTLAYGVATLEEWFSVVRSGGAVVVTLNKKADTDYAAINGTKDGVLRWQMLMATAHAEDATNNGSHWYLQAYNNAGAVAFTPIWANRKTGKVSLPHGIAGGLTIESTLTVSNGYVISPTSAVLGGASGCYLYPNYPSGAGAFVVDTAGDATVARWVRAQGYWERSGTSGSYGTQIFNSLYVDSSDIRCYVGASLVGRWTPACDYRVKKDVTPLPRCWDAVKALRPITYTDKAFGDEDSLFKDGDTLRSGFIAHELQDALGPSAATGEKDGEDLQGPNVLAIVAALTSALQEAQLRIEALETERTA